MRRRLHMVLSMGVLSILRIKFVSTMSLNYYAHDLMGRFAYSDESMAAPTAFSCSKSNHATQRV